MLDHGLIHAGAPVPGVPQADGNRKRGQPTLDLSCGITRLDTHVEGLVREVLNGPGEPLNHELRTAMESHFGSDFSQVRVHTDESAAKTARTLNAQAYTVGSHIIFDADQYAPHESGGLRLLAHELAHVIQQSCLIGMDGDGLGLADSNDGLEEEARCASIIVSAAHALRRQRWPEEPPVPTLVRGRLESTALTIQRAERQPDSAPDGGMAQPGGPPGICGPDVTKQFSAILSQIQADFKVWDEAHQELACRALLFPVKMPKWTPGTDTRTFIRSAADINSWDVLPLFQGQSAWLRSAAVVGCPCAIPTSKNPSASAFDDVHEDPSTCSDSVQAGGECWLNGTVNYGTFGIMVRLCKDRFPVKFALAQQLAEKLIQAYKAFGPHPEDATLPLAWFRATFNGGPTATPSGPGNRPQCKTMCSLDGSIVDWDYVWEPVKPRTVVGPHALYPLPKLPLIKIASAPPPPAALPAASAATSKTYRVVAGDSLSKIAQRQYGDPALWTKIYAANRAVIGPNPNLLSVGQELVIP